MANYTFIVKPFLALKNQSYAYILQLKKKTKFCLNAIAIII